VVEWLSLDMSDSSGSENQNSQQLCKTTKFHHDNADPRNMPSSGAQSLLYETQPSDSTQR